MSMSMSMSPIFNSTLPTVTAQNGTLPQTIPELAELKDIHLPDPITFWPPAPSVWITLIATIVIIALIYTLVNKFIRRSVLKRVALGELKLIANQSFTEQERLSALGTLVRRIAISRFEQREVASLSGGDWLTFLDNTFDPSGKANLFREGHGQLLGDARYGTDTELDTISLTALHQLIKEWINRIC